MSNEAENNDGQTNETPGDAIPGDQTQSQTQSQASPGSDAQAAASPSSQEQTSEQPSGEGQSGELNEELVREELKKVIDPELFVNIVDLGLIYTVTFEPLEEKTKVGIEMTMTSPMCPAGPQLVAQSRQVVEAIDGVGEVEVKIVMDPPWTQERMTDDARDQLGIF